MTTFNADDPNAPRELRRLLEKLGDRALDDLGAALYQEALEVQRESMRRTPVSTGSLRASHETQRPERNGQEVGVRILVGGPAAPYAAIVHERLDLNHPVGRAKFLESAALDATAGLEERLAARLRRALERK